MQCLAGVPMKNRAGIESARRRIIVGAGLDLLGSIFDSEDEIKMLRPRLELNGEYEEEKDPFPNST
jgi:hypothetical protein